MQVKSIEKAIIKKLKSIDKKPNKHKLDMCKDRAKAIYKLSRDLPETEIERIIDSEVQEIVFTE